MLVCSAPFGKDPADGRHRAELCEAPPSFNLTYSFGGDVRVTRFSHFLFVGLNYSFGSMLNNVVNPRYGGGDGGGGFFFSQ